MERGLNRGSRFSDKMQGVLWNIDCLLLYQKIIIEDSSDIKLLSIVEDMFFFICLVSLLSIYILYMYMILDYIPYMFVI